MKRAGETVVFSPSDLIGFVESPFVSWMDRRYLEDPESLSPDEDEPLYRVLQKRGHLHETGHLDSLRGQGLDICEISDRDSVPATLKALAEGREVIYQASLEGAGFAGYADFLRRVNSGGQSPRYAVWDTKLARHPKPYFLIQLCCYAEMIEVMTGGRPETVGVVLGDGDERAFRTDDFWFYYQHVKKQFLELMDRFPEGEAPAPDPGANHGRWSSHAERWLVEKDHLSRVANISRGQIAKLNNIGIATMAQLAAKAPSHVKGIGDQVLARLKAQARLQVESAGRPCPLYKILQPPKDNPALGLAALPPVSKLDIFFDMEGYPAADDWLEYLFGAVHLVKGRPQFNDWWAHDERQEKAAFAEFIDWAYQRWQRDPSMHIYHYGAYETGALKRLMGKYGRCEDKVDDFLRNGVFVDLLAVVRRGVMVGEPSYSLKNLERLYMEERTGDVQDADSSVVFYDAWCESGESQSWKESALLKSIRDYNEVDCRSTWMLANWLRERQVEAGITYFAGADETESGEDPIVTESEDARAQRELAESILNEIPEEIPEDADSAEQVRVRELLAWLVEFHRRADKPMWWQLFARLGMTTQELWEDMDCIGGIVAEGTGRPFKQSQLFDFRFDPDQDTKLKTGDKVKLVPDLNLIATIEEFDPDGYVTLKVGNRQLSELENAKVHQSTAVVPYLFVDSLVIQGSIADKVTAFKNSGHLDEALKTFLFRLSPKVATRGCGNLKADGEPTLKAAIRLVKHLENSCLCLQGPPGTGKTFTAAHMIMALWKDGKRVGITSNSHKAILNLMKSVCDIKRKAVRATKVGGDADDDILRVYSEIQHKRNSKAAEFEYSGEIIGGTAWFFSRPGLTGVLDYLFVDEAGQVSLGNLVGMSSSARNIVLVGDQMQLAQPVQGRHPGESGKSTLEYLLRGHDTIPPDRGLFLETSWRMHPDICSFISDAVYESRLSPEPHTVNRLVKLPAGGGSLVRKEAGLLFVPVEHEGNVQGSDEEAKIIRQLVKELVGRELTGKNGKVVGKVEVGRDILFVAPYNMQVRKLKKVLPGGARVASVDKFQGQQAPVVIVSMCASAGEAGGRGLKFILDKNRLNVAVSRAQSLAIVVGDPRLADARCGSIDDMRRFNLYCWIQKVGGSLPVN